MPPLAPSAPTAPFLCVNLMSAIRDPEDFRDPNEVKVVVDREGNALYFSREPIPSGKKYGKPVTGYRQVCIMPFRRDFLFRYTQLPPTPLEIIESVDMLRILEHGYRIRMVETPFETCSVDTPEDLRHVEHLMEGDPLTSTYQEGPGERMVRQILLGDRSVGEGAPCFLIAEAG